jgi:hypothetical protein
MTSTLSLIVNFTPEANVTIGWHGSRPTVSSVLRGDLEGANIANASGIVV